MSENDIKPARPLDLGVVVAGHAFTLERAVSTMVHDWRRCAAELEELKDTYGRMETELKKYRETAREISDYLEPLSASFHETAIQVIRDINQRLTKFECDASAKAAALEKMEMERDLARQGEINASERADVAEMDIARCREIAERDGADYLAITRETAEAMKVLDPSMPESGIVDAAKQVKQAAISWQTNSDLADKEIAELKAKVRTQMNWIESIKGDNSRHGEWCGYKLELDTANRPIAAANRKARDLLAAMVAYKSPETWREYVDHVCEVLKKGDSDA